MIPNRKIPAVGMASYGRDFLILNKNRIILFSYVLFLVFDDDAFAALWQDSTERVFGGTWRRSTANFVDAAGIVIFHPYPVAVDTG